MGESIQTHRFLGIVRHENERAVFSIVFYIEKFPERYLTLCGGRIPSSVSFLNSSEVGHLVVCLQVLDYALVDEQPHHVVPPLLELGGGHPSPMPSHPTVGVPVLDFYLRARVLPTRPWKHFPDAEHVVHDPVWDEGALVIEHGCVHLFAPHREPDILAFCGHCTTDPVAT